MLHFDVYKINSNYVKPGGPMFIASSILDRPGGMAVGSSPMAEYLGCSVGNSKSDAIISAGSALYGEN